MKLKHLIFFIIALVTISCDSIKTATYDQFVYQKTIQIKVEADKLIDKSSDNYSLYESDVENLKNQLVFILEYEKNRPNNEISYTMWELMSNKDKNLLMGYLELWKKNKILSISFSNEAKKQIDEGFSLLLKYEAAKTNENKTKLLEFINPNK